MIESLKQQRERLLALRDKATVGPWWPGFCHGEVDGHSLAWIGKAFVETDAPKVRGKRPYADSQDDARFIASAHELAQCLEAHAKALEDAYSMLAAALPHLETVQDEGPGSEGWQSDKLSKLCCGIDAAIAARNT